MPRAAGSARALRARCVAPALAACAFASALLLARFGPLGSLSPAPDPRPSASASWSSASAPLRDPLAAHCPRGAAHRGGRRPVTFVSGGAGVVLVGQWRRGVRASLRASCEPSSTEGFGMRRKLRRSFRRQFADRRARGALTNGEQTVPFFRRRVRAGSPGERSTSLPGPAAASALTNCPLAVTTTVAGRLRRCVAGGSNQLADTVAGRLRRRALQG